MNDVLIGDRTDDLAARCVRSLVDRGATLAVGESLTGGLLADAFVRIPGASQVFVAGLVTYTNSMKHALLAVSTDLLNREGAVHPDVALAMAGGVRQTTGASVSLATTGVAGPGPADGHPAGRAYIAVMSPEFTAVREVNCDPGDQGASQRNAIRRCVVYEAVALLAEALAVPNREKQM